MITNAHIKYNFVTASVQLECSYKMFVELLIFGLTALLGYFLYLHKRNHNFFEERGVKYIPGVPIFGNILKSTFLKKHMVEEIDAVYKAFPDEK